MAGYQLTAPFSSDESSAPLAAGPVSECSHRSKSLLGCGFGPGLVRHKGVVDATSHLEYKAIHANTCWLAYESGCSTMGFTKDPNHRRRVDAETQRNRDAEVARMRRVTASGTARRWGRSSRCPRDRPRLLQDGRGPFETRS